MDFDNSLKYIRMKEYAMDRPEFAEMLCVNLSTYYSYESNASMPTLKEAWRISSILRKTINEIWYPK